MTDMQKQAIIAVYNAAVHDQASAEEGMDNATNDKSWQRHADKHSFALGKQSAIDRMLSILGYDLIVDDEKFAVDIQSHID